MVASLSMPIKELEKVSLMVDVEEKVVILSYKHINLFMIFLILEGKLFMVMMVDLVGLEEKMGKMEVKQH